MIARFPSVWLWLCCCAALAQSVAPRRLPAAGPAAPAKMLAILIGIREHNRFTDLRWPEKDVLLVKETLQRWCGCAAGDIVLMTNQSEEKYKPNRGNILAVFREELQEANEAGVNRVLLYFAGHGEKDPDGALYLVPQDFVAGQFHDTGLSIAHVRTALQECRGIRTKLLVLDTCYAGNARSRPVDVGHEIGANLRDTQGMLTLASCKADERSLEFNELQQGLFTYWFCRGLAGAADLSPYGNGDGRVDTDELQRFVTRKVREESRGRQNPVAIPSPEWQGRPVLAYLSGAPAQRQTAQRIWQRVEQSLKYRNGGNFADALAELERTFQLRPAPEELRELFALRGRFHLERGKVHKNATAFQAALGDFDQAIRLHRSPAPPCQLAAFYALRCEAHFELRQYKAALQDASQVVQLQPACAQAFRNRAIVHRALGDDPAAQDDLRAAAHLPAEGKPPETVPPPAVESPSAVTPDGKRPIITP